MRSGQRHIRAANGGSAAPVAAPQAFDDVDRAWIAGCFRARWGGDPEALEVDAVRSRTASVARVSATVGGARRTTFVKRCAPRGLFGSLAEYFDALRRVTTAVAAAESFAPLDIVGIDVERGLLMTASMPGATLASIISRRSIIAGFAERHAPLSATFGALARYLTVLHGVGAGDGTGRARTLGVYTTARLTGWADADARHAPLARRAATRVDDLVTRLDGREPPLVLCHGDVTPQNVLLGDRLGLIDWDDLRWDFPAADLSQVVLGIGHLTWLQRLHTGREPRATIAASFRAAYRPWPDGAAWQLPHLRNLAVYLVTLAARRKTERGWARRQTDRQYQSFIAELTATLDAPLP
jgi:aminoglycoside phosphotransferase (APT) family kinase protein